MISASEYRKINDAFMTEYENEVRIWLRNGCKGDAAERIPFFRDGATCPETWFQANNGFRPLFILKEVSLGFDCVEGVDGYISKWGNQTHFEFAENPFDDIKIGTFSTWKRIAHLAKGLEDIYKGESECDYYKYDFSFMPGGEEYSGDIIGYNDTSYYKYRTANPVYNEIIEKIAVINIKKIGGGTHVDSPLSRAFGRFSEHIAPFGKLLCKQIELIDPSVIICCGSGIIDLMSVIRNETASRLWIDGYHPAARKSNEQFYCEPLQKYKDYLSQQ